LNSVSTRSRTNPGKSTYIYLGPETLDTAQLTACRLAQASSSTHGPKIGAILAGHRTLDECCGATPPRPAKSMYNY
jgi:hypothetical protein